MNAITVPLSRGHFALVDEVDYAEVSSRKWSAFVSQSGYVYAVRYENGKHTYLHRWLMGEPVAEAAARAYDAKARQLFGEFARCNFPEVV